MNQFTEKEKVFIENLEKNSVNISHLIKKMKAGIYVCYSIWVIFSILALIITFVIGEKPKIYHILFLASFFIITLGICVNCRYTLGILLKFIDAKKTDSKI